ncbi:MAG: pyridoxamine 5-phosphate oxidase-related FMN-binding protein [Gemmatimonadetes bacterium]|nr:pyridoxamine 5-phosphate oxidase-related FMN-binding protein [Gemmatimonadota bacterium]
MSAKEKNEDNEVPLEKKLDDLYALIDGIETAMFTTRRQDGHLVSRPMQVQERRSGTDLWFVTDISSDKLDELVHDPHVNLAFYKDRTREWVSVSGAAVITQDKRLVHEFYKPDWKAWFGDEGGDHDGGPDDPRLALILVDAQSVIYSKADRPMPMALFAIAKAMITGEPPKVSDQRELDAREIKESHRTS